MSKTLLNGVNEVLKKVKIIDGDSGVLTTLTDTARQLAIDNAVQAWNEAMDELYVLDNKLKPNVMTQSSIVLVTSTRAYSLASDLTRLHWPLLDTTNGNYIEEFEGGYEALWASQPIPSDYTSLPSCAAIRPSDGYLYIDTSPSSDYNGRTYYYNYEKDVSITAAASTFPFTDVVFRAMVPAVSEIWKRNQHREFDGNMVTLSLSRAARYLRTVPESDSWMPGSDIVNTTDPLNA